MNTYIQLTCCPCFFRLFHHLKYNHSVALCKVTVAVLNLHQEAQLCFIYSFQLAAINSFPRMSKQGSSLSNPVLSDRIRASFIRANPADINCVSASASVV